MEKGHYFSGADKLSKVEFFNKRDMQGEDPREGKKNEHKEGWYSYNPGRHKQSKYIYTRSKDDLKNIDPEIRAKYGITATSGGKHLAYKQKDHHK